MDWTVWNEPTDNRLQSEHPASLWPALRAASPWQFTCPADTMRFVRAGQLPLSRCAQPPHGRWDLQHWLWWVAERRPNVMAQCVNRVLGLHRHILTTLYLFRCCHIFISRPFLNQTDFLKSEMFINVLFTFKHHSKHHYLGFFVDSFSWNWKMESQDAMLRPLCPVWVWDGFLAPWDLIVSSPQSCVGHWLMTQSQAHGWSHCKSSPRCVPFYQLVLTGRLLSRLASSSCPFPRCSPASIPCYQMAYK